jgi:hypothetical protein
VTSTLFFVYAFNTIIEYVSGGSVSTACNEMTKKRCSLTCENLETVVYLHEMWPKTREWEARKHFKADVVFITEVPNTNLFEIDRCCLLVMMLPFIVLTETKHGTCSCWGGRIVEDMCYDMRYNK